MSSNAIRKVAVVGGTGVTGRAVVDGLLNAKFEVSILSRDPTKTTSPASVNVIKTDYSHDSIVEALKGQDAVVSTITTFSVDEQKSIIDAAIEAGVRRFIPSEFGVDTSSPTLGEYVPPVKAKTATVGYLKTKEHTGLTWTGVIVGAFFDWCFGVPGLLGINVPGHSATIFDGGDIAFEATNLAQIGRTVAAVLAPEHLSDTANRYVYVNSFTITQNQMVKAFEAASGKQFTLTQMSADAFMQGAQEKMRADPEHGETWETGARESILLIMINYLKCCEYSKTKGLWNEKLGLPKESLEDTIKEALAKYSQ